MSVEDNQCEHIITRNEQDSKKAHLIVDLQV